MITKSAASTSDQDNVIREGPGLASARDIPIVRAIKKGGPRYHVGSVIENKLGSQVLRVLSKQVLWRIRASTVRKDVERYAQLLGRDGVLVIEDFLSPIAFGAVRDEYEKMMQGTSLAAYKDVEDGILHRAQLPVEGNAENLSKIDEHFRNNEFLNELASSVIRRPVRKKPDVFLDLYRAIREDGIDNDIENILHADLHMPTVKMFFYLEPANSENGAFVYAKGSHKLTVARLAHEYDLSVRQAQLRAGATPPDHLLAHRADESRNIIDPKHYRRMHVSESVISVEPNSLVVANNMGFHRRGEIVAGKDRKAILINYRNSDRKLF